MKAKQTFSLSARPSCLPISFLKLLMIPGSYTVIVELQEILIRLLEYFCRSL